MELAAKSGHIVLLGDSIFDNRAYTRGEPDVVTHLQHRLPAGWEATLLAVDGATTSGVPSQVRRMPKAATHVVVSVGGNDALQNSDLLQRRASSAADVLRVFAERVDDFESSYRAALEQVLTLRLPTTVCTIYNGNLPAAEARIARVALTTFNDAILRTAFQHRVDVIELRSICCAVEDYANPIEPSGAGGRKIAAAIWRAVASRGEVRNRDFSAVFNQPS